MDISLLDPDLLQGEIARRSFKDFVRLFWPVVEPGNRFIDGMHVDAICSHLEAAFDLERLIISAPRRHSKSLLASVFFPAWHWLHDPSCRFLAASHSLQLARDLSIKCRTIIRSELYQKCYGRYFKITEDNDTIGKFANDAGGYRQVASVGARTTGAGANVIIFDDPNDLSQIGSQTERQSVISFWRTTLSQTINPGKQAARIIVQQRCHPDDLTGFLLDSEADLWTHLCLAFEYNPEKAKPTKLWTDPRREPGEALSTLISEKEIKAKKRDVCTWETQYNQNPTLTSEDSFIKRSWFNYFNEEEDCYLLEPNRRVAKDDCWLFATCDPSAYDISTGNKGDYTAIGIFAVSPQADLLLVHLVRQRLETTQIVPTLQRLHAFYGFGFIGIESVAFQKSIIQHAKMERLPVRALSTHVKKQAGEGAKEARAFDLQTRLANGQVYFLNGAKWLPELELELLEFPNGKYDDQVECLSYGAMQISRVRPVVVEEKTELTPEQQEAESKKQYYNALFGDLL